MADAALEPVIVAGGLNAGILIEELEGPATKVEQLIRGGQGWLRSPGG